MLEVGKLYRCSEYFLLLYPDKDTASSASAAESTATSATVTAAYWTRELGKPVSSCNPQTPLLVLSTDKKYVEVLAGDCKGWIIYQGWLNIKEIVNEAA